MKFWLPSTDGAPILLLFLMFSTEFCVQGASAEASEALGAAANGTVEIPCSLDDGNRTDCNNSSPISSGSTESRTTPNLNSSDVLSALCLSGECSTKRKQEGTTTSHEFSSVSALDSLLEADNQTETEITTGYSTNTPVALNETFTPCSSEGCLESNGSEPSLGDALIPSTNSITLNESSETTHSITATYGLNETLDSETSNINDSLSTEATTEFSQNDTSPTSHTVEAGNSTETATAEINLSNASSASHSVEAGNSTEMATTEVSPNNTFVSLSVEAGNSTETTTAEVSPSNTSTSHSGEDGNSTAVDMTTDYPTSTDEAKNASVSTPKDESSYNGTFDNTTEHSSPTTRSESPPYTTTDGTLLDNTTLLYTSTGSNFSTSENESMELSSDTSSNVTDATMTTTESPSVSSAIIIVELRVNCSDKGQERDIALLVAKLLNATLKNDYSRGCNYLHNISLSITHGSTDLATIRRILSERGVEVVRVIHDDSADKPKGITPPPDNDITQSELILYITLGVSLGAIFLIALAIICFKCCRRRPSKPVDLDVPHLNLRLEDYTLTRIPRPNTCYLDYFRAPIVSEHYSAPSVRSSTNAASESNRGMVQPFDTSVVPLEDAKKLDQVATSPNRTSCPSTPLRTFGRKDWKNGDKLIYENVISSSTEKLHPDFYKYGGYAGTENPTFAA